MSAYFLKYLTLGEYRQLKFLMHEIALNVTHHVADLLEIVTDRTFMFGW